FDFGTVLVEDLEAAGGDLLVDVAFHHARAELVRPGAIPELRQAPFVRRLPKAAELLRRGGRPIRRRRPRLRGGGGGAIVRGDAENLADHVADAGGVLLEPGRAR